MAQPLTTWARDFIFYIMVEVFSTYNVDILHAHKDSLRDYVNNPTVFCHWKEKLILCVVTIIVYGYQGTR